jgi:hypothetical protein
MQVLEAYGRKKQEATGLDISLYHHLLETLMLNGNLRVYRLWFSYHWSCIPYAGLARVVEPPRIYRQLVHEDDWLSAIRASRLYSAGRLPWYPFLFRIRIDPRAVLRPLWPHRETKPRPSDCSTVPQPTAPSRRWLCTCILGWRRH